MRCVFASAPHALHFHSGCQEFSVSVNARSAGANGDALLPEAQRDHVMVGAGWAFRPRLTSDVADHFVAHADAS